MASPQHFQQHIHRTEEKSTVEQINKYYSNNVTSSYKSQSPIDAEQPQSQNQLLQNQFSKMQQQMQKRRGLTRGLLK